MSHIDPIRGVNVVTINEIFIQDDWFQLSKAFEEEIKLLQRDTIKKAQDIINEFLDYGDDIFHSELHQYIENIQLLSIRWAKAHAKITFRTTQINLIAMATIKLEGEYYNALFHYSYAEYSGSFYEPPDYDTELTILWWRKRER